MAAGRKKRSLKGAFITFEGIDGCGKTTQARRLAKALRKLGVAVREFPLSTGEVDYMLFVDGRAAPIKERVAALLQSAGLH